MVGVRPAVSSLVRRRDGIFAMTIEPFANSGGDERASGGRKAGGNGTIEGLDDCVVEACGNRNAHCTEDSRCVHDSYTSREIGAC